MPCRALVFDFNGTLSDDEPIMYRLYADLFAEHGRPLTPEQYRDELAGHTDEEVMRRWLGERPDLAALVAERVDGYRRRVSDGSTISDELRRSVRRAAARVPVAIVSGAARAEIAPVVAAAGLAAVFAEVVCSEDVHRGKPDPEGYLVALARLRRTVPDLAAAEVTVLEDTEAGVSSATAAGMRCIGVLGTLPGDRLAAADEVVESIDVRLVDRLLA